MEKKVPVEAITDNRMELKDFDLEQLEGDCETTMKRNDVNMTMAIDQEDEGPIMASHFSPGHPEIKQVESNWKNEVLVPPSPEPMEHLPMPNAGCVTNDLY